MDGEEQEVAKPANAAEPPARRRRAKKVKFPKRAPSVVEAPRELVYVTADKTTCAECPCFPREDPYDPHKKLNSCLRSPPTLYELCARAVDAEPAPWPFAWSVDGVVQWMSECLGFPQYEDCIRDNAIDGMRLLMLEDPSLLPEINVHYHDHIQKITSAIRRLYGTELVRFARSVGLPPRYPLTHVRRFKSRTGPRDGYRQTTTATELLRRMQLLMPSPVQPDHWELVWYRRPYLPRVKFARVQGAPCRNEFWGNPPKEPCREYKAIRKFRMMPMLEEEQQFIWLERRPGEEAALALPPERRRAKRKLALETRLKSGNLLLDRRKLPRTKFLG